MRVMIFSGGRLGEWALKDIAVTDRLIGADRGALFLLTHRYPLHAAIGDFDSVRPEEQRRIRAACEHFIACDPVDKDRTDTEMAFRYALSLQPQQIILYGGIGTRMDHSLANIHLLETGRKAGVACRIVDEFNEIQLCDNELTLQKSRFTYVSLLPLTARVTGIRLRGFRYPLDGAVLEMGQTLAISNMLVDEIGTVSVRSGLLLVMQSTD